MFDLHELWCGALLIEQQKSINQSFSGHSCRTWHTAFPLKHYKHSQHQYWYGNSACFAQAHHIFSPTMTHFIAFYLSPLFVRWRSLVFSLNQQKNTTKTWFQIRTICSTLRTFHFHEGFWRHYLGLLLIYTSASHLQKLLTSDWFCSCIKTDTKILDEKFFTDKNYVITAMQ